MAMNRAPDTNVESLLAQGKARASGRGEPQGYARGGRVMPRDSADEAPAAADKRMKPGRPMFKSGGKAC